MGHGPRRVAAVLAVLVVLLVGTLRVAGPPPTTSVPATELGTLVVGERARGTYQVGGHTVVLSTQSLSISHPRSVLEVWASPPGRAFITAAMAEAVTTDRGGLLRLTDRWDQRFRDQTIDGADVDSDGRLVITGSLRDPERGEPVAYQLFVQPAVPPPSLGLEIRVLDDVDRVTLSGVREVDERVLGLGMQFAPADLRGRAYPIVVREQGIGRGSQPLSLMVDLWSGAAGSADTTDAALPFYVTSSPRSLWLTSDGISVIDLRGDATTSVTAWDQALTAVVAVGGTPAAHVSAHARATGLMRPLPPWVGTGLVAGLHGGSDAVQETLRALRAADVPLAAVWLPDWAGVTRSAFGERPSGGLSPDPAEYPDWPALVASMADEGLRVLTQVTPLLAVDGGEVYAEAAREGHLVTTPAGVPYLVDVGGVVGVHVDLLDADGREWYAGVLADRVLDSGVAGFMADLGHLLPLDAVSSTGSGPALHNAYPTAWVETTRRALEIAGLSEEGLVWHRSAGPGSAAHASTFQAGEQMVDFSATDGLPSAVDGILSAGISGLSSVHAEIGGGTSVALPGPLPGVTRSPELHMRSAEVAAFTTMMRTAVGTRPDLGATATTPEVAEHLAGMVDLFVALGPERARLASAASQRGLPFVRHPSLVVPDQPDVVDQPRVFFLGPDLFVAPVLQPGQREQTTRLPVGEWVHLWSGEAVTVTRSGGAPVTVDAPLGSPPVWARAGSAAAEDLAEWISGR